MRKEQGFSLVELLIVVAIIAIIAAIAVPSLLTSRMAANEASGIEGCRTAGSSEVAYAAVNNQNYTDVAGLAAGAYLDSRFTNANGFNGYTYGNDTVVGLPNGIGTATPTEFGVMAYPVTGIARYTYAIGVDQVVRYEGTVAPATTDPTGLIAGDPIGKR
ncbi:MAG TPA: prepilin-type N-terminal cleavage/methylation domain-containing protein [Acidobacteriota bacterium]|nr:prepilin-type N-terminal cleavage/methylation domain-containing protein [Acidobacteriota bacterium]